MIENIKQAVQKGVVLYLVWLLFVSFMAIISLAELSPLKFKILQQENVFAWVIETELFFVFVLFPFFLPTLMEGVKESWVNIFTTVFILFLFPLPIMLVCQNLSVVDGVVFIKAMGLVFASAFFVSSLFVSTHLMGLSIMPYYFLILFIVQAMGPFLGYLSLEYGLKLGFMDSFSPFKSVLDPHSQTIGIQILVLTVTSLLLFASTIPLGLRKAQAK